jgi:hypothetical protein
VNESEQLKNILKLYPNPATSELNFYLENESTVSVIISDVLGKVVLAETTQTNSVSVDKLKSGIYFVTVKTKNGAEAKVKFIKE